MAYSRNPTWQNSPAVTTPITAAALENIEAGLVNAAGVADSSITALANKEPTISRTGATTGQVATLQAGGTLAFAPGVAGATGATGATGTAGATGAASTVPGPAGATGSTGSTGAAGSTGTAATVTTGTTTTGAAGTSATVTNSGTASAAVLNFVVPQGVAGSGATNATTTTVGSVQLAGDLAGTALAPTVPGLAAKAPLLVPTVVKTTAYTAVSGDLVRADATTASFAVTLPAAVVGSTLAVKKVDTSVNTITITPAGTDTIDGLTSAILRLPNATQRLIAVAGGWVVADGFNLLSALDARFDAAGAAAARELLISRTGATAGQVPVLQAGGALAFATVAGGASAANPIYGDGIDGAVTITTAISLSTDMFYQTLTVSATGSVNTNGYRVFVRRALAINTGGSIFCNGGNANVTGANSSSFNTASLSFGPGSGGNGNGSSAGVGTSNSYGGSGGAGGAGTTAAGAAGGTATGPVNNGNVIRSRAANLITGQLFTTQNNNPFNMSIGAGASGGNGGAPFQTGVGGGGGGIIVLVANSINNQGTISCNGGSGSVANAVGGGGGGGGGGGVAIVITDAYIGNVPVAPGGSGGAGNGAGIVGTNGNPGSVFLLNGSAA